MSRRFLAAAVIFLCIACGRNEKEHHEVRSVRYAVDSSRLQETDRAVLRELRDYVDSTVQELGPCSSAIVVSRGGSVIFEDYLTGREDGRIIGALDERTLWPAFSVTKAFTATLLLSLACDGTISLDDHVGAYLAEFSTRGDGPFDRREVTVRHLASHTSGVSIPGMEEQELFRSSRHDLGRVRIVTEPGRFFSYSSLGMHVLERAIEAAAGRDFAQMLSARVLEPLGLESARYLSVYDPGLPVIPTWGCTVKHFRHTVDGIEFYVPLVEVGHRTGTGLYVTAREAAVLGRLWLTDGTFNGHAFFTRELKKEAWRSHGARESGVEVYGLLWWLFSDQGGYAASGAGRFVVVVVPGTEVVISVARNRLSKPFDFLSDKLRLISFGRRLGLVPN